MKQLQQVYQKMAPERAYTAEQLAAESGFPEPFIKSALRELVKGQLVEKVRDEYQKKAVFKSKQMGLLS